MATVIDSPEQLGARIKDARTEHGSTQATLAARVGVDRSSVAKIENGTRQVSATELVRIAAALDRPIDWFVTESPPTVTSRRSDPLVGSKSAALDRLVEQLARDIEFLEAEGLLADGEAFRLAMPETFDAAERAAREARDRLGLGDEPIVDLQRECEKLGLLAFSIDVGEHGDAAFVATRSHGVAIINGNRDPGRRRFSLAHELGHHIFADAYGPEIIIDAGIEGNERLINAFAIHLLLPRASVTETFADFDDEHRAAVAIGTRFRVSWTAVCAQLKNLGVIDEAARQRLSDRPPTAADYVELGERWTSELDSPAVPPVYGQRIIGAYKNGRLTAERAIELLHGVAAAGDLPNRTEIPLESLRPEFDQLP